MAVPNLFNFYQFFPLFLVFPQNFSFQLIQFLFHLQFHHQKFSNVSHKTRLHNQIMFQLKQIQQRLSLRCIWGLKKFKIFFLEFLKITYLNDSPSYNQQFPFPSHVLPQTKQVWSSTIPKNIGLGINEKRLITIRPKPIATGLSFSSTHLTDTRKFVALPVAPENFKTHITVKNITNSLKQSTGHDPGDAVPPRTLCKY